MNNLLQKFVLGAFLLSSKRSTAAPVISKDQCNALTEIAQIYDASRNLTNDLIDQYTRDRVTDREDRDFLSTYEQCTNLEVPKASIRQPVVYANFSFQRLCKVQSFLDICIQSESKVHRNSKVQKTMKLLRLTMDYVKTQFQTMVYDTKERNTLSCDSDPVVFSHVGCNDENLQNSQDRYYRDFAIFKKFDLILESLQLTNEVVSFLFLIPSKKTTPVKLTDQCNALSEIVRIYDISRQLTKDVIDQYAKELVTDKEDQDSLSANKQCTNLEVKIELKGQYILRFSNFSFQFICKMKSYLEICIHSECENQNNSKVHQRMKVLRLTMDYAKKQFQTMIDDNPKKSNTLACDSDPVVFTHVVCSDQNIQNSQDRYYRDFAILNKFDRTLRDLQLKTHYLIKDCSMQKNGI